MLQGCSETCWLMCSTEKKYLLRQLNEYTSQFQQVFYSKLGNCLLFIKALTEDIKFFIYSTRGYNMEH